MSKKKDLITDILRNLSTETLQDLYLRDNPDQKDDEVSDKDMIAAISDKIENSSIKILVSCLNAEQMRKVLEDEGYTFKEGESKRSLAVLSRRIEEKMATTGVENFLAKNLDKELLKAIAEDMDIEATDDKQEIVAREATNAAKELGIEKYLSSFEVEHLYNICDDLKLKNCDKSKNKRKLLECIIKQEDLEVEDVPKKKKAKTVSTKKKALKKGITYDEIFQHYYLEELRSFCKDNELKTSGTKKDLIKRILAFFEGGIEATDSTTKKGRGKGKGKGKSTGKKDNGEDKKEEKEEEKESVDEKEEEEKKKKKEKEEQAPPPKRGAATKKGSSSDKEDAGSKEKKKPPSK